MEKLLKSNPILWQLLLMMFCVLPTSLMIIVKYYYHYYFTANNIIRFSCFVLFGVGISFFITKQLKKKFTERYFIYLILLNCLLIFLNLLLFKGNYAVYLALLVAPAMLVPAILMIVDRFKIHKHDGLKSILAFLGLTIIVLLLFAVYL